MFESIIEEIKKIRHTNTPEKIILSKNNYNKLLAELEPEKSQELMYAGVFGHTRIESSNYLPDGEILKIMPDLTKRPMFDLLPTGLTVIPGPFANVFEAIEDAVNKVAEETQGKFKADTVVLPGPFARYFEMLEGDTDKLKPVYVRHRSLRKHRAHFRPHLRRRLKAVRR